MGRLQNYLQVQTAIWLQRPVKSSTHFSARFENVKKVAKSMLKKIVSMILKIRKNHN